MSGVERLRAESEWGGILEEKQGKGRYPLNGVLSELLCAVLIVVHEIELKVSNEGVIKTFPCLKVSPFASKNRSLSLRMNSFFKKKAVFRKW